MNNYSLDNPYPYHGDHWYDPVVWNPNAPDRSSLQRFVISLIMSPAIGLFLYITPVGVSSLSGESLLIFFILSIITCTFPGVLFWCGLELLNRQTGCHGIVFHTIVGSVLGLLAGIVVEYEVAMLAGSFDFVNDFVVDGVITGAIVALICRIVTRPTARGVRGSGWNVVVIDEGISPQSRSIRPTVMIAEIVAMLASELARRNR